MTLAARGGPMSTDVFPGSRSARADRRRLLAASARLAGLAVAGPFESMTGPIDAAMKTLEAQTAAAWAAMAASGNPNHDELPRWPAYTADDRSMMIFDTPCRIERDPGVDLRKRVVGDLPSGFGPTG